MEILKFVINPDLKTSEALKEKFLNIFKAIKFGVLGYLFFIVLSFIEHILARFLNYSSQLKTISNAYDTYVLDSNKINIILLGIFLVPFLEEIAFRGFMNLRKIYVAMSIAFFSYILLRIFAPFLSDEPHSRILSVIAASIIFIIAFTSLNESALQYLKDNFKAVFYVSNILFVMMHISNYNVQEMSFMNYLFFPIALLPQTIASINLSYIRVRNGLVWSILFHSFYNSIFYLPLLIK